MLAGEITSKVTRNKPASPQSGQPPGTMSQEVVYSENNLEVARVHQFVLPSGALGGSGFPDPKRIYEDGIAYHLRSPAQSSREKIRFYLSDQRDRICWWIGIEVD
jgi:hypothetical protein